MVEFRSRDLNSSSFVPSTLGDVTISCHTLIYYELYLFHMCSYHMPSVGLDRIMVISLVLRIHRSSARTEVYPLGDDYPRVVTVREGRKRRVNVHRTTPYRVTPYRV
jgi:hypothetical protein